MRDGPIGRCSSQRALLRAIDKTADAALCSGTYLVVEGHAPCIWLRRGEGWGLCVDLRKDGYFDAPRVAVIGYHHSGQRDGMSYFVEFRDGRPLLADKPELRAAILAEMRRVARVMFAPYEARTGQPEVLP